MKTALRNVRVFDGRQLLQPGTVVLDGDRIGSDAAGAEVVVDGAGAVLLPGLTDAHLHLDGRPALERLVRFGVTTALDMANAPPEFVDSMRGIRGLTDIRSAGTAALAPGSIHSHIPEIGERGLIRTAGEAERFVTERFAEGSNFLKVLIDLPGPSLDRATVYALVATAHRLGRLVVAHALSYEAAEVAQVAGVDALTHTPLDRPLDRNAADRMAAAGRMLIPTLVMMEALTAPSTSPEMLAEWAMPDASYDSARASVAAAYRAGVPVLAGTDTNTDAEAPGNFTFGDSLHHELELLVDAGLSTIDALRAATVLPAEHFGLTDRGVIAPGRRADLVLVDGDPLHDIRAVRSVSRVWCGGIEHTPARLAKQS
ncbi:amidohydrolase family protein [Planosporangium thailandense]|uniref:Amidohydrolase family protein n=1 Tax=Planosporangium thailandense TaxID=765197 RepID=A0ABX0Y7F9_9ACTN|nr:amidohydrolase family protein [Planosporangium thailandense]NJC73224.1 amidohydrolase family protein [Planosporangium thailandense]